MLRMGSVISVIVTAALGTWLAYVWQQRSAKQARYFEASKAQFELMRQAATNFAEVIGARLYAMHRICALDTDSVRFSSAFDELVLSIENWNKSYLQIELNVRTLFARSRASDLEALQSRLNSISNKIIESAKAKTSTRKSSIHDIALLRTAYFRFLQKMLDEADYLFRQMHFGVRVRYDRWGIRYFSNLQLIKALLSGSEDEASIVRAPTDFSLPVRIDNARFGVN